MIWTFEKTDVLPEEQFFQWEALLERRAGIQLAQAQHVLLQTQVALRMREIGVSSYKEYFDLVSDDRAGVAEWQVIIDRLLVKETTFFRHRPSLEFVRQYLQNRLSKEDLPNSFEIWSVGCSTGEEPYSLAAIATDCFERANVNPYFGVTGVDLSLPALAYARRGEYGHRSIKLLTEQELARYFKQAPGNDLEKYRYQINESIRKRVCFSQMNLLSLKSKPLQLMDIIFCQNVMIYFRRWRRREIMNHLVRYLKPGGILVVGLGEVTDWKMTGIERVLYDGVQAYVKCN